MFRRILFGFVIFCALSANAMAASNPMVVQTGPLVNIFSLVNALGGGTLLDQVPGTTIYLLDLPNLPVMSPMLQSLLGIVFIEPDKTIVSPARGQLGLLNVATTTAA